MYALSPRPGQLAGCISAVSSSDASGNNALQFNECGNTASSAGAQLPIAYDLSSLSGAVRYAAPNGSTGSSCTSNSPCTLERAISQSSNNHIIVMRGGTYREKANLNVNRNGLRIVAYPGESPILAGSITVPSSGDSSSGWNTDGSYRWRTYRPRPLTDGSGIPFSTGMTNLSGDGVGRYPDQAWIGDTQLKQVLNKNELQDGRFWVDRNNNRLYLTAADAAKNDIETSRPMPDGASSDRDRALYVTGSDVVIEGIKITRYSNTPDDYGVVTFEQSAQRPTLRHVEISHVAFITVVLNRNDDALMEHVTLDRSDWMGFSANQTDNLTLKAVKIINMNPWGEFTRSPQSGALKTARTKNTKVLDSYIADNNSHGIWYDESNMDAIMAGNVIVDNTGSGVFWEISDGLLFINNFVRGPSGSQAFYAAGSSGVKLINNTIIGGGNSVGIYTDDRSQPNCSNSTYPLSACGGGNTSVLTGNRLSEPNPNPPPEFLPRGDGAGHSRSGFAHQPSMDWMPRVDLMINNIIAYPIGNHWCGNVMPLCITTTHSGGASTTLQAIFHQANSPWPGLPRTLVDGNVYATNASGGQIIRAGNTTYTSLSTLRNAMAGSPVNISGFEANGLQGTQYVNPDGSPTAALIALNNQAVPVPSDTEINKYIPAGTRHYGILFEID